MSRASILLVLGLFWGLAWLAGCRHVPSWTQPDGASDSLILDVAGGGPIGRDTLVAALRDADFVLLGETHDNLDHHRLQAGLIEALSRDGGRRVAAVAFEMIETDQQPVLVEFRDRQRGRVPPELGSALAWEERGWPPFAAYRPILAAAQGGGAEIVAAGLPEAVLADLLADGHAALPASFLARTGLARPLPPSAAADLGREIAAAHCGQLPADLTRRMAQARRAEDAMLADRLATVAGRGRGVLIAGVEHARKDRGVPWYLAHLRPKARTVSVALVEADRVAAALPGGLAYARPAYDYLWLTPGAQPAAQDQCEPPDVAPEQLDAGLVPSRPLPASF